MDTEQYGAVMTEIGHIKEQIMDIGCDTDKILKMEDDEMDDSALIAMLQNKGIDPGLIALMRENDGGFGGNG